jgi:hypothetical protein
MSENAPPASPPRAWRTMLPREHGSWSLAAEPLVLGLIAAPSPAGLALALAAMAAFLARRPVALWLGGRPTKSTTPSQSDCVTPLPRQVGALPSKGRSPLERGGAKRRGVSATANAAALATLVCGGAAVAFLGAAAWLGPASALAGLLAALPPAALFLYFDARREARAEAAELAGAVAFAVVPGVMGAQAGWPWPLPALLAFTAAARSVPVVLTVRAFLRARRGEAPIAGRTLVVTSGFAVVAAGFAWVQVLPWTIVELAALSVVRALWLLGKHAPAWPARRLGIFEAVFGALCVLLGGLAWRWF